MNDNKITPLSSEEQLAEESSFLISDEVQSASLEKRKYRRDKFPDGMQKKVILIRPDPVEWSDLDRLILDTPISLMAMAAVLQRANVPVEIIDFSALTPDERVEALDKLAERDDILIAGLSIMSSQVKNALKIVRRLKEVNPDTPVILGGIHAVLYPEESCSHELVDYVCFSDGEEVMLELVDFIYYKREGYPSHIKSLVYKKDGAVQKNEVGELPDIDDLPFQPFKLLDIERYIHRTWHPTDLSHETRSFNILTGKGCPFRCTFCVNALPNFYDREYRGMDADRILDECEYFIENYDAKHFKFIDELFFANSKRLFHFLNRLEERGLNFTWAVTIRPDYFTKRYVDQELLARMKRLGCRSLAMGAESGSQRILDLIKKDMKVEATVVAAEELAKAQITASFSFMYGMPTETNEDMKKTFRMLKTIADINDDVYIYGPQIFRPYPGSSLYDVCVEKGYPDNKRLEDWDVLDAKIWGTSAAAEYKWLDNPKKLPYIGLYGKLAYTGVTKGRGFVKGNIQRLLSVMAKFRFENDFYFFPFEYWTLTFLWEKLMPFFHSLNFTRLSKQGEGILVKQVSTPSERIKERQDSLKGNLNGVTFRPEFGGIDPRTLDISGTGRK